MEEIFIIRHLFEKLQFIWQLVRRLGPLVLRGLSNCRN